MEAEQSPTRMRPPAPMTRRWVTEKNSFPVRGLVMYRWPAGWGCNVELLRITREQIASLPTQDAAYEIALSAVYRYVSSEVYEGEKTPVKTARGNTVLIPNLAFELAKFLVDKVSKLILDGGGGINLATIAASQKFLARATTGSPKDAKAWNLPAVVKGAERVSQRLEHEAATSVRRQRAIAARRKALAKFWFKNKYGFHNRGLAFTGGPGNMWAFNVPGLGERLEPVPHDSSDEKALVDLSHAVSLMAIDAFVSSVNVERDGNTELRAPRDQASTRAELPDEVRQRAADRLSARLLKAMKTHRHGVLGLVVIERCLAVAFDPLDDKPLEDYPFPLAPTADPADQDRAALDLLNQIRENRKTQAPARAEPAVRADAVLAEDSDNGSWRQEIGIEDWVPLDEPFEDDETIDRRAMEKADHDQSAALRRLRGDGGGRVKESVQTSVIQHKIDYAGLPKDDE
jgi:hypothetical protein